MTICQKCGSQDMKVEYKEPLYIRGICVMEEHLLHTCRTCGYAQTGPCKDAKK